MTLFKRHRYTTKDWKKGYREIPRLTFEGVGEAYLSDTVLIKLVSAKYDKHAIDK